MSLVWNNMIFDRKIIKTTDNSIYKPIPIYRNEDRKYSWIWLSWDGVVFDDLRENNDKWLVDSEQSDD